MGLVYRNRFILNQRAGAIDIDNTSNQEQVQISHRTGSNINLSPVANSEFAAHNKQVNVIHDSFETVNNDKLTFTRHDNTNQTGANSYNLKGFENKNQLEAFESWKEIFKDLAVENSQFRIKRGGSSLPNGTTTSIVGARADNPTLRGASFVVNNTFNGYNGVPIRRSSQDDVTNFTKVNKPGRQLPAIITPIAPPDVAIAAGPAGSSAPGVIEFGVVQSSSTEEGDWEINDPHKPNTATASGKDIILQEGSFDDNDILQYSETSINSSKPTTTVGKEIVSTHSSALVALEQQMGEFGDDISIYKRNKFSQVGAAFNDYPSTRIDDHGRSQPLEYLVGPTASFKNHDYISLLEEVDNSTGFPCGNDDKLVGNRYSRTVGSGGIQLKTTGSTELGGTILKVGFKRININASNTIHIGSEESIELQSLKSITLRTNRQVYIENALGVRGNAIIGGGAYVEGELYCHHITAPLEVQQTEDTIVFGQFATNTDRSLVIGECNIFGEWYPVYARSAPDLIVTYPHSHHFNSIPMRLTDTNKSVRTLAANEYINSHGQVSQSLAQDHSRKRAITA